MNSRQAIDLLNGLEQYFDDYCELNDEGKAAFRMAKTALELFGNAEQLPSAPQRAGRWIHDGYAFKGGIDWMHCSECGHKDSWSVATRTPFCGWCGARMEDER